jgi:NAD(P)-dependent dehydrogenase (short-subunit alcohol dehydrogenase family)
MATRLSGKRALIFGGGTGLGRGCAESMLREGAAVFVSGRRPHKLQEVADALADEGRIGFEPGDARVEADVIRIIDKAVAEMGGLDVLVMSSGMSAIGTVTDTPIETYRTVMDTNVLSVFLAAKHAAGALQQSGRGSIIVIASVTGVTGMRQRAVYCASKAAVLGMVRAMALDFAEAGVRVNAISPSLILTELAHEVLSREQDPEAVLARRRAQHPLGRLGEPRDIGDAAVYLAADESSWVTGQNLIVDGGFTVP